MVSVRAMCFMLGLGFSASVFSQSGTEIVSCIVSFS